jgi:hypothetical protein
MNNRIWKGIEAEAIEDFAQLLVSKRFWLDVKMFVTEINSSNISNLEKKQYVIHSLETVFGEVAEFTLNLVIELAVAYIKSKQNA